MECMKSDTAIPEVDESLPDEELDKLVPDLTHLPSEFGQQPLSSLIGGCAMTNFIFANCLFDLGIGLNTIDWSKKFTRTL